MNHNVILTENAKNRIKEITLREENEGKLFRLEITGGGCNGFQYKIEISKPQKEDIIIKDNDIKIAIDASVFNLIEEIEIDFQVSLKNGRFTFFNKNSKQTCSCGNSFSL